MRGAYEGDEGTRQNMSAKPTPGVYRFSKGSPVPRWFGEYASMVAEWGTDVIVDVNPLGARAHPAAHPLPHGEYIIRGRSV
jgi:hypothetical protein